MRILSFEDFRCNADPLYKFHNVLKLDDLIALQICLFVHDFINNKLPSCFNSNFQSIKEINPINTKSSVLGCIHVPYFSTTKYGLNSISRKCIDSWNFFTKRINCNLIELTRSVLKRRISSFFIDSY